MGADCVGSITSMALKVAASLIIELFGPVDELSSNVEGLGAVALPVASKDSCNNLFGKNLHRCAIIIDLILFL